MGHTLGRFFFFLTLETKKQQQQQQQKPHFSHFFKDFFSST